MNGGIISKFWLFLNLIRAGNVAFLVYLQFSFLWLGNRLSGKALINTPFKTFYSDYELMIGWIFPTTIITMFGYVLNDFLDFSSDVINHKRPSGLRLISQSDLKRITVVLAGLIPVSLCVVLYILGSLVYFNLILVAITLLIIYSLSLKCKPLAGNICIGLLCCLALYPTVLVTPIGHINAEMDFRLGFMIMIFVFTVIREIIKDLDDIKGDRQVLCETFPVVIGMKKTREFLLLLFLLTALGLSFWMSKFSAAFTVCIVLLSMGPLLFVISHFARKEEYGKSSSYMKYAMISSSLLIYVFGALYSY